MQTGKRFKFRELNGAQQVEIHTAVVGLYVAARDLAHDYKHMRILEEGATLAALEMDVQTAISRAAGYMDTIIKVLSECQERQKTVSVPKQEESLSQNQNGSAQEP